MDYEQVFQEAVRIWREHKSAEPALEYVHDRLVEVGPGELRGRLLYLLGMFQKRTGTFEDALVSHREAVGELSDSPYCLEVLVSMVDIHVVLKQVEDGYRSALQAERLLGEVAEELRVRMKPILAHNMGRLSMLHGDYATAAVKLEGAIEGFTLTGRVAEAQMVKVRLAEAYVELGRVDEAEVLCNAVRGSLHSSEHALVDVNVLLGRIALLRRDTEQAKRAVDRARTHLVEGMGQKDFRALMTLIRAEADLDEARGDNQGASRLRLLLDTWTGCGYQARKRGSLLA